MLSAPLADPASGAPALQGPVTLSTLARSRKALADLTGQPVLDLSGVSTLDVAGAWAIASHLSQEKARGRTVELTNASEAQRLLLSTVTDALPEPPRRRTRIAEARDQTGDSLAWLGRQVTQGAAGFGQSLGFLGLVVLRLAATLIDPRRLRLTALVHHMQDAGVNAVPIVALMGFLIGVVLAFQGASQLEQFGAEIYVVDLIAISMLRELGVLLTAIIVAGRSASAFTAALGSMKMREEIDAMRVLGLNPIELLVLPRLLALVILLPVLSFIANMAGLAGGAIMAWIELGISPGMFQTQLLANTSVTHALVGLSKAPVFAAIIAIVGCHQGLQVGGDTESLGNRTSRSVVVAIFLVIVVDALFSIFFAVWGV